MVTYVDSSVVLSGILAETTHPADEFWQRDLASSRLLIYEVLVRLHALRRPAGDFAYAETLLAAIEWLELEPHVLSRATRALPEIAVQRTLDALHLATADFLRSRGAELEIATYDKRLAAGARALGFALCRL